MTGLENIVFRAFFLGPSRLLRRGHINREDNPKRNSDDLPVLIERQR
jgi:hypothetical protein